jgi:ADP-dependent NAD(P)H-hydrate dehydratase
MPPLRRNKRGAKGSGASGQGKAKSSKSQTSTTNSHRTPDAKAVLLSQRVLRQWPLPQPDEEGDKEDRGRVLVVGGACEMPGAVILAATAALRAGAGKLQIAAPRSIAQLVATEIPESRVIALPETRDGALAPSSAMEIVKRANDAQALLIGPGLIGERAVTALLKKVLSKIEGTTVVLDAEALSVVASDAQCLRCLKGNVILTPHAGEMSRIMGVDKMEVTRDPLAAARAVARELRAVVALKGAQTFIVTPQGDAYFNRTGNVGLATSGSGDTLSGIITGLAARGAEPLQAAAWGVYLHGSAGERLAKRIGPLGFLARELLAEIPTIMARLDGRK